MRLRFLAFFGELTYFEESRHFRGKILKLILAPEILDYNSITAAADIWSLGTVLYVMITGYSPFAGETIQETYLNVATGT